jgi:hypothetical protein
MLKHGLGFLHFAFGKGKVKGPKKDYLGLPLWEVDFLLLPIRNKRPGLLINP